MLNDRELGTVLAALRHWQRNSDIVTRSLDDIASPPNEAWSASQGPLDDDEIDALCERLNTNVSHEIANLIAYANSAPASDPGEGYWADLDATFGCGERSAQYAAAAVIRDALTALGIDAPTGKPLCEGCSRDADEGEHDPDCTLADDEEAEA